MNKITLRIILACVFASAGIFCASAQDKTVRFAFITDAHLALDASSVDDLSKCIADINRSAPVDFVIFGGDMTDFGSDKEIALAKSMLDTLAYPYYVLAGNHDANWSESGCNTFLKVFGYEHFEFEAGGWRFLGCNSGPDMRMAPALVPRESMLWLESLAPSRKSIFINHYPMDSCVLNYSDVTRQLKKLDVRFEIGGHFHANMVRNYSGIPAAICRSSLSKGKSTGYNIVKIENDRITFSEKRVFGDSSVELAPWYACDLAPVRDTVTYDSHGLPADYPWMRYDVNEKYASSVTEVWKFQDDANIVAGSAISGTTAYYTTASGYLKAVNLANGAVKWKTRFGGKIFSTPAVAAGKVVFGCTDGFVYAVSAKNGNILWKKASGASVVASPVIRGNVVYIGDSGGHFRALNLADGTALWTFDEVVGHCASKPYVDDTQVVFGSWGKTLYSLDPRTGRLQWKWEVPKNSRMYSPASCVPLKSHGRIFVAVPDRRVYVLDATSGKLLFNYEGGRDAIGLSEDGSTVFSKTMFNRAYAFPADTKDSLTVKWNVVDRTGYEIAPTALVECNGMLLIPTDKGNIIALSSKTGEFLWAHKLSVALVNPISMYRKGKKLYMLATTMDGCVSLCELSNCLEHRSIKEVDAVLGKDGTLNVTAEVEPGILGVDFNVLDKSGKVVATMSAPVTRSSEESKNGNIIVRASAKLPAGSKAEYKLNFSARPKIGTGQPGWRIVSTASGI